MYCIMMLQGEMCMTSKKMSLLLFLLCMILCTAGLFHFYNFSEQQLADAKEKPILFGSTYMTLNNPFFDVVNEEMRNVIEANGDVLITMDPELSLDKQIDQIHTLMELGCSVLIVNPVDSKGLADVLAQAKAQGIIIIAVDTNVYNGQDFVDYTVVSDNYQAGVLCAQNMMKAVDHANIMILRHEAAYSAVERIQGFKDAIADYPQYHIVDEIECEGQLEISMPLIAAAISEGVNFDVVMALNDPSALGAVAALQEAERLSDVLVYGVDGTPEAKVLVKDGFMQATVAQYPKKMGKKAVESAYRLLNHESGIVEEKIPVIMIDGSNIDEFSLESWQ